MCGAGTILVEAYRSWKVQILSNSPGLSFVFANTTTRPKLLVTVLTLLFVREPYTTVLIMMAINSKYLKKILLFPRHLK